MPGIILPGGPQWFKPRPGTHINPLHPLSRGLLGAFLFNEPGGLKARNAVSPIYDATHANLTNFKRVPNQRGGYALDVSGSSAETNLATAWTSGTTFSVAVRYKARSAPVSYSPLISDTGATRAVYWSSLRFNVYDGADNNSATNLSFNTWYDYCASVSGGSGTHYVNGKPDGTMTGVASLTNLSQIGINSSNERCDGIIDYLYFWNRALSLSEVVSLRAAPFAMYEPAASRRFFFFTSGGVTSYTLNADPGVYTISGAPARPLLARVLKADAGSYAVSGSAARPLLNRVLAATAGSYIISGTAARLAANRTLNASPGSYVVTGRPAGLAKGYVLAAAPGSYSLSGAPIGNLFNRLLSAAPGSYTVTGAPAAPLLNRTLNAAPGNYTVTGANQTYSRTYVLGALPGSYVVSGRDADLTYSAGANFNDYLVRARRNLRR